MYIAAIARHSGLVAPTHPSALARTGATRPTLKRPGDVVVLREDDDSVVFTVDVAIRTANDLASAERHKLEHYAPITRHSAINFIPFAVSTRGRLGVFAAGLIKKLATIESVTALARPHPPPCAMFVLGSPTASLRGSQMQ